MQSGARQGARGIARPDIAVCVLFFNKLQQTIECITSFLGQDVPIYVLDNASAPESAAGLASHFAAFPDVHIFRSEKNIGVGPGRNFLITRADHEWLFFVDNDIRVKNASWYENARRHLAHSEDIDAFIPRIFNVREGRCIFVCRVEADNGLLKVVASESDYTNWFMGGGSIVRRDLFDRIGRYDEEMKVGFEDYELALRAIKLGRPIVACNIHDIMLLHDHRYSARAEDRESCAARYDASAHRESSDRLYALHGVRREGYETWLMAQRRQQTSRTYAWGSFLRKLVSLGKRAYVRALARVR